ncbi:MAG: ATP-binding cassette domain-containing protein [Desulfobacterales bacterium]|nr:ATP-binding cassette domain-containing protein [Desulfobacterales bacterium]
MFQVIARDLAKEYRIYDRPVDRLLEALFRRPRHKVMSALNGISFTLEKGRSLGVIGDNGAGKSTLLKILVGTLSPTRGSVELVGRVAALLELGAGFHPEFTGRQNILLSASLMGIPAEEIEERKEEIIAFSELEEFIDQPVKTYSSGMYIRLAFGIATSVDPDVLVIDEALAVGDYSFQRKCVDRMTAFRAGDITMLICSHSMYHIQELCDTVLWLDRGRAVKFGNPQEIVSEYEDHCRNRDKNKETEQAKPLQYAEKDCHISYLGIETPDGEPLTTLEPLQDTLIRMEVKVLKDGVKPNFGFAFVTPNETIFSAIITHHDNIQCGPYNAGQKVSIRLLIKDTPLRSGTFRLLGTVAEDSALLWYESKNVSPITVKGNKGIGQVTFKREWDIQII